MVSSEEEFIKELEIFKSEADQALQFFYLPQALHTLLRDNKYALKVINQTPLFWNANLGALQSSLFITINRVFDEKSSKHNVYKLLKKAESHPEIFSKEALKARKRKGSSNADEWIDDYMKDVYVPTLEDFESLKKHVADYCKLFEREFMIIRHQVFAHKGLLGDGVENLFANTRVQNMENLVIFLKKLHNALSELFHNGRKPILRPIKYSVSEILKAEPLKFDSQEVHEQIVRETQKVIETLTAK